MWYLIHCSDILQTCADGKPAAEVALVWNITTTSVNAIISAVVAVIIYMALRPALKKANLFLTLK